MCYPGCHEFICQFLTLPNIAQNLCTKGIDAENNINVTTHFCTLRAHFDLKRNFAIVCIGKMCYICVKF